MVRTPSSLIERDGDLRVLEQSAADLGASGSVVLVSGEAGFGKTSLLKEFAVGLDHRFRVLYGTCDPIDGPAAFAPLYELIDALPPDLSDHIRNGAEPVLIYAGVLDLMKGDHIVLILEDVQWADESTLGLIRYLGRRIDSTSSLLVVSYRGEELGPAHPLHSVIADAAAQATRIELAPLTLEGVRLLATGSDVAVEALHAATRGNPFFVDQVLKQPDVAVPDTVGEAVLANAGRLPGEAMEMLRLIAISPDGLDYEIVTELISGPEDHVDLAIQRRLLELQGNRLRCRHELIRISLEQAIPQAHKQALHARLIPPLEQRATSRPDTARLAHHSVHSGDGAKAIRYSLEAAADALAAGSHGQAALHYANALSFKHLMDESTLDEVLLSTAREQSLLSDATRTAEERLTLVHGEPEWAAARAWVAYFASRADDIGLAHQSADEAIRALHPFPPSEALGRALSVRASVLMAQGSWGAALGSAAEAMAIAKAAAATEVHTEAAITYGTLLWLLGDGSGRDIIDRAGGVAFDANFHWSAVRALNNLGVLPAWEMVLPEARRRFDEALAYAVAKELDTWHLALRISRAHVSMMEGRFDEAMEDLEYPVDSRLCASSQCEGMIVRAALLGRRGDAGAARALREAIEMTDAIGMYLENVLTTALALEGAWLGLIDTGEALERYSALNRMVALADDPWGRVRVGFWALRLGVDPPAGPLPGPVGLERDGDIASAANLWEKMGFPVEAALTRAASPDALLESVFAELSTIGAYGVAVALRRRLRAEGVRGVPRGIRRSTAEDPDGLTHRQAEVLTLLAEGMTNAAIAQRLFISEKTASHHVSAILKKLGVESRAQAIVRAVTTARA